MAVPFEHSFNAENSLAPSFLKKTGRLLICHKTVNKNMYKKLSLHLFKHGKYAQNVCVGGGGVFRQMNAYSSV